MSNFYGSSAYGDDIKAVVKWFNPTKGFGFVKPEDGSPDAFLHVSVLEQIGRAELPEGAEIVCRLMEGNKGLQVAQIVSLETIPDVPPSSSYRDSAPAGPTLDGTVKFFNAAKGFGFVVPDDGGPDVFVSARVLERAQLHSLEPEQRVRVTTRVGQKGPMADTVELT